MTTPDTAREVAERIRSGNNFLITSHRNPDGDALGSGLGLQRLIRRLGKNAAMQVRPEDEVIPEAVFAPSEVARTRRRGFGRLV